jgi:hypothetical protein
MFKRIVGYVVGAVTTVVGFVGAGPIGEAVGIPSAAVNIIATLLGIFTGGSAAVREIPNTAWTSLFWWLGAKLSAWGRRKYGVEKWEAREQVLDIGSFTSWLAAVGAAFQAGLDSDDES